MRSNSSGLSIVSIGGGTGLSTLLSGLKAFITKSDVSDRTIPFIETLTAVVTVTDDGGSSGRLREEFQILPPGDIRNCMAALAEDERLLTKLFQHRFESEGELSGHSFGNLFLTALASVTGDFLEAIKVSSEVLAIKGRIYPSTAQDVALIAELEDGRTIQGETNIVQSRSRIKRLRLSSDCCNPLPETLESIQSADIVTIGPGSLYTSIVPNLLVDGIVDTLRNSPAIKVYISNIMTQPGETDGFTVEDHLNVLFDYAQDAELDYVVVNNTRIGDELQQKYQADGASQVDLGSSIERQLVNEGPHLVSLENGNRTHRVKIVFADVLQANDLVRHNPGKLARFLLELYRDHAAVPENRPASNSNANAGLMV